MTLLAMERIKLVSTRSPWWCTASALALVIGMTVMLAATSDGPIQIGMTGFFLQFGVMVMLVMAAVSVTTEYRYSTIRTTFQAVPNRTAALLAKTAVVGFVSGLVGLAASFGAWGTAWLIRPESDLAITTADEWRAVAGAGLVFALAAVLAVAVGIMVRHTAGAVALLLVWALCSRTSGRRSSGGFRS
jgi:ABC-2 type transport system permease protein